MPPVLRTLLAVLAGLVVTMLGVMAFTWLATLLFLDRAPDAAPVLTPAYLAANVLLSFAAAALGGWTAAALARERAAMAVWTLAVLLLVLGIASSVGASPEASALQPTWYRLTLVPLGFLGALLGGLPRVRRVRRPAAIE